MAGPGPDPFNGPDGQLLASGSADKTIILWDLDLMSWQTRACQIVSRNFTRAEYAQYINPDPAAYDSDYARIPTCPGLPVQAPATATLTPQMTPNP